MVAFRAYCRCLEALIIDVAVGQEINCILSIIGFVYSHVTLIVH